MVILYEKEKKAKMELFVYMKDDGKIQKMEFKHQFYFHNNLYDLTS